MSIKEIVVPDIGDFDSVEVIEVLVKEGDIIQAEDSLVTVESDKASMEIPSSESGKILKMKVALGDKISEGSILLLMEVEDTNVSAQKAEPAPVETSTAPTAVTAEKTEEKPAPAPVNNSHRCNEHSGNCCSRYW